MITFRSNIISPFKKMLIFYQNLMYKLRRRPPASMTILHCRKNDRVKSERLNALRKQYDSFLEEDRKRKERNEYILGRLDKMRACDKLVVRYREPFSNKVDHPALLNNRSCRNASELQPFQRNYSVEPPARSVDELDLLRVISKNYILIPKRDHIIISDNPREFTPENNTPDHDNDWKSKYEILNQLKKREKEPIDNVVQSTEINECARNRKYEAEYLNVDKQSDILPMGGNQSPVTSLDPEIPERDFAHNDVQLFGNGEKYPVYKELLKPIEQIAMNDINDTSEIYSNHVMSTIRNSALEEPQAYIESDESEVKELKENYQEESETHVLETTVNFVSGLDQTSPELKQSKEIINQDPLFKDDQEYPTEVANIEEFTPSEVIPVQQDVLAHSTDLKAVNENSVQQEYNQEQLQYTPAMTDSEHVHKLGTSVPQDQENKELVYSQETNENYGEYIQHDGADNYTAAQFDNTQNYDQTAQAVNYDQNTHDVNYEQNVQDVNYYPNSQNVNYDNHAVLAQDDALNYEQAPKNLTADQNAQNANYDQTLQEQTYEGDAQQNYADDPSYAHTDQSQPVGEHYDENYPVDGVYQPDTSYAPDQVFDDGVGQNYANDQNKPVTYDLDITQQQYDQTYAEQYSAEEQPQQYDQTYTEQYSAEEQPQVAFDQPHQYQQEYVHGYDQHQQDDQDAVEGVQQQLDREDGYVEQSPVAEGNANEVVPEETVPVTTT